MTERELRAALADAAARAVPDGSRLGSDVVTLAATRTARWTTRRGPRFRLALAAASLVAAVTAAGALAVASGTLPIQFRFVEEGRPASATADPATQRVKEASNAAVERRKIAPRETEVSLAEAEAVFGTHVLLPAGLEPNRVVSVAFPDNAESAKPGAPAFGDAVSLVFTVDGSKAEVWEQRDDSTTPLTVDALDQDGPMIKADGGLGRAAIETVAGGSYVVGYSVDGSSVVTVMFKSTAGVVVTIRFEPGMKRDVALDFATSFE